MQTLSFFKRVVSWFKSNNPEPIETANKTLFIPKCPVCNNATCTCAEAKTEELQPTVIQPEPVLEAKPKNKENQLPLKNREHQKNKVKK
jgi:hypothetical protein